MKKISVVIIFMFFCLNVFAGSDMFSYIPYKSATWKNKMEITNDGKTEKFIQNVYYSNKKMRSESESINPATEKKENMVSIITNKKITVYNPDTKTGNSFSPSSSMSGQNSFDYTKYRNKAVKKGTGKASGVKCNIYTFSFKMSMGMMKTTTNVTEYRSKKDGFVMKTITETPSYKVMGQNVPASKTVSTVSKLKKNAKIKDSLFSIPKNIKIRSAASQYKKSKKMQDAMKQNKSEDSDGNNEVMEDMMKGLFGQ